MFHRFMVSRAWAYKKLSESHELWAEERFDEALELMNEMSQRKRLNLPERALVWQTYAYLRSSHQRCEQAAESFEKCLALDALPEAAALNTQWKLGYEKSRKEAREWISRVEWQEATR